MDRRVGRAVSIFAATCFAIMMCPLWNAFETAYADGYVPDGIEWELVDSDDPCDLVVQASQLRWDTSEVAVLAPVDDKATAMVAVPLAGLYDAPLLLTDSNELPETVIDELVRLGVNRVEIVGGPSQIGESIENYLVNNIGISNPHRLWGNSTELTSLAVLRELRFYSQVNQVFVTDAGRFESLLPLMSYAYATNSPIVLAGEDSVQDVASILEGFNGLEITVIGNNQYAQESTSGCSSVQMLWGSTPNEEQNAIIKSLVAHMSYAPLLGILSLTNGAEAAAEAAVCGSMNGIACHPDYYIHGNALNADTFFDSNAEVYGYCYDSSYTKVFALDFAGFDKVASDLMSLPDASDIDLADLPAISNARSSFSGLDSFQKSLLPQEDVERLNVAVDKLELLEPVATLEQMIEDLPKPEDVTRDDGQSIAEAEAAFDALTGDQLAYLSAGLAEKLAAVREAYKRLPSQPTITRIAGDYANQTSAKISAEAFDSSDWVVIARDDDFADALGAVGLAGALDAPIILTDRFGLSPAAASEITRLGAKHAYIIGGTGAIKSQVDSDLKAIGVSVEPRIWGDNSYDTSLACAQEIESVTGEKAKVAIIAMSTNFQDALSMSPYAYRHKVPVVLQTWGDTSAERGFTADAQKWLSGRSVLIAGGVGAVSEASVERYPQVARLWGDSGYETSNAIAEWMVAHDYLDADAAVLACGAQAPKGTDALAGAALAGRLGAPMLLVNSNTAMESADFTTINGFYSANKSTIETVYVLGGAYVMPDDIYARARDIIGATER